MLITSRKCASDHKRKWLQKQPLHRSEFVRNDRAITLRATHKNITPKQRTRWHVTENEREKHSIICRPNNSYRANRRRQAKLDQIIATKDRLAHRAMFA